jgi:cobaltochelatase CobN
MHRLAAIPGGWTPNADGVIFVEQTAAPIVVLTAADTDGQTLANCLPRLPEGFPSIRMTNLLQIQQQLAIDAYTDDVLSKAQVVVVRLLGGVAYWPYGLEVLEALSQAGLHLIVVSGDGFMDPGLMGRSSVDLAVATQVWRYFTEGGVDNWSQGLQYIAQQTLGLDYAPLPPSPLPNVGVYNPVDRAEVGILFYRSHLLAGNTSAIDALIQSLGDRGVAAQAIYVSSLKDGAVQAEIQRSFEAAGVSVVLNTTSFAIGQPLKIGGFEPAGEADGVDLWTKLDMPVFQVILSGGTEEAWRSLTVGLSPRDMAMNVALPEVDGRIITRAVSFKAVQGRCEALDTEVVGYKAVPSRMGFVADLAAHWVRLGKTVRADRKVALILANYPNRDGRLANGVGLDTPQSCVEVLRAMLKAGYDVNPMPADGEMLMKWLTESVTNDSESQGMRPVRQVLEAEDYGEYWRSLPEIIQTTSRWELPTEAIPIPGIQLGNVFIGIQPARGYDKDPSLNYHAPDLEPPHEYLAFYHWVRSRFNTQAIVHLGKHGNLEWLPGKSVALDETCYPEIAIGPIPHFYPFIVNDPGEGSQAKRRAHAVILDHLTPPMTRAELYGDLQGLEALMDEYYEAITLDPVRVETIRNKITALMQSENIDRDLGIDLKNIPTNQFENHIGNRLDQMLCEFKEAQIRDGLHIFGQCPSGSQLRDLVVAIARQPQAGRMGLTRAIALDWQWEFDPLIDDPSQPFVEKLPVDMTEQPRIIGDAIEAIEMIAANWIGQMISGEAVVRPDLPETTKELRWIKNFLIPNLYKTTQEIEFLLHGLDGGYVPSGPSGAPTRGRPEVLPTGRNFYSVDIRSLPTESAWDLGRRAAEAVVERYTQDNGEYPKTLGLSVWGTSAMRTGGDDIAQAMALMGVQPVWEGPSRRVVDFEVLPLSILGRPRVDVTLRISGFFRDAFPNLIDLFDQAVQQVAALDESDEDNPLAAKAREEMDVWLNQGVESEEAAARSTYRIFGSKPGAYGAGLQGVMESQNWDNQADLAQAYMNWSSYAYGAKTQGAAAPEAFSNRLTQMQVVLQNQDNREHDVLDSDDYYQFQGGMSAAVKTLGGKTPSMYFGDNAVVENPKVRSLAEEITKVYRTRAVNPKWIAGAMRHGYKGAFEMAATVDFLFAYDATTDCVADYMYEGIAQAYLFDETVQAFIARHNPWAMRDMAERLLEANQRGLWQGAKREVIDRLQELSLRAEGEIEGGLRSD